jgi:acetyl-CoA carboxylase carboxyl transferase subunit alpha
LVDDVIPEPLGGAHRHYDEMAQALKKHLLQQLTELQSYPLNTILEKRYRRLMAYGIST